MHSDMTFDIAVILEFIVGIIVSIIVLRDAQKSTFRCLNIPPFVWAILAFVQPAMGLLAYWIMNKSSLRHTA